MCITREQIFFAVNLHCSNLNWNTRIILNLIIKKWTLDSRQFLLLFNVTANVFMIILVCVLNNNTVWSEEWVFP